MKKLPLHFYKRNDVVQIARELLGKLIITNFDNVQTSGRIVETEAYVAHIDKASHSFNGKRTGRNEHMYAPPGTAYVYICYGMHQMFNVVTNEKEIPDAILVRAIEPINGIETMLQRTGKKNFDYTLTKGPGNVGKALGINKRHSGLFLLDDEISIYDDGFIPGSDLIGISKRIGVESAGADALLPYRFYIKGNKFVSGRPVK
ncbi:MAG TPA: DNA-3-methyladenine glycosylase [Ferruginibacter sp.]|nr:DNA-3-methyladenine glycosylase [Ferruginibacter sp.]